jgi:putative flippase GtrA
MKKLRSQLLWFLFIGSTSAATHWLVAVAAVEIAGLRASLANVAGWMVAFFVSFSGHYTLTFRHQHKTLLTAIWRFWCVSAAGFLINEIAFVSLLDRTPLPYYVLLALVLVGIAAMTFVFSRYWAFRHRPH